MFDYQDVMYHLFIRFYCKLYKKIHSIFQKGLNIFICIVIFCIFEYNEQGTFFVLALQKGVYDNTFYVLNVSL